jgi:chitinase
MTQRRVARGWHRIVAVAAGAAVGLGGLALAAPPASAVGVPEISVGNASITEGDTGTRVIRVMVSLHQLSPDGVTATWRTTSGTATGSIDYKNRVGKLYFKPGQVTRFAKIVVKPDAAVEGDEQFTVDLLSVVGATVADSSGTATIVDAEAATGAEASIGDATVREGFDGDSRYVWLAVALNQPAGVAAQVTFATGGGTAVSPDDYSSRSGTLTFRPKARVAYVLIYTTPDAAVDGDKTFDVTLSSPVNLTIGDGTATVTITDDD